MRIWAGTLKEKVERWENDESQKRCGDETADNDNGQRALRFRTDAVRKRHRQQAEHGEQRCHQHRAEPRHRAMQHRFIGICAFFGELVEIAHHDHAVEHRLAEERNEANRRRNAQRNARAKQRKNAADQPEWHIQKNQAARS